MLLRAASRWFGRTRPGPLALVAHVGAGALRMRIDLLPRQQAGDRNAGATSARADRLDLNRRLRPSPGRPPAGHDAVVFGDQVLDLHVQAGTSCAPVGNESAHAIGPDDVDGDAAEA